MKNKKKISPPKLKYRGRKMGLVHADIELTKWDDISAHRAGRIRPSRIRHVKVRALVDSGAFMMCINADVQKKLNLAKVGEKLAILADGSCVSVDVVGPVQVRFANRTANVDAMLLPGKSDVLLGAIPMEYMDVLIDPKRQRLIVNPEHPDIAAIITK
jgi:clan AA aspartic protease